MAVILNLLLFRLTEKIPSLGQRNLVNSQLNMDDEELVAERRDALFTEKYNIAFNLICRWNNRPKATASSKNAAVSSLTMR